MGNEISSEFFIGNRAKLRELFTGTAPIVLTASGQLQRGGDNTYPFQQDASFWYLTGIDRPDVILVMDKENEYLILPERTASQDTFNGAYDPEDLMRQSGIVSILNFKSGWKKLETRLKKIKHLATLSASPSYVEAYGMYTNPARRTLIKQLQSKNTDIELLDLREHIVRMRMVKQPAELEALQYAIDITIDTLKDCFRPARLSKYANECELEADITQGFRKRGSRGHAFDPIVAGGVRATTIHQIANNAPLVADELVVVDVGAENLHYAADITRTVALNENPSRRQQEVHEGVKAVQDYALSLLKPGVLLQEYEKDIEHFMGEKLRELGLVKSIDSEKVRKYYPHATTHFLGLDVHDVGLYDRPLEPGTVLTVEPGIYIPEESLGVRIEDDVLITSDGVDVLSKRLSRELV